MKIYRILGLALIMVFLFNNQSIAQKFENANDSLSYSVGILFAKNAKQQGLAKLNPDIVSNAINDYLSGKAQVMPDTECEKIYMDFMKKAQERQNANVISVGKEYLANNAKQPGVMVTDSGLQYEIMTSSGSGQKPGPTDKVKTHYHGTTIDGVVFDSSVDRGEPISFPVNGVIKGWTEALQMMDVGDKWKLTIPSELAYGARGAGPKIGPHSVLIFEVELLGIE